MRAVLSIGHSERDQPSRPWHIEGPRKPETRGHRLLKYGLGWRIGIGCVTKSQIYHNWTIRETVLALPREELDFEVWRAVRENCRFCGISRVNEMDPRGYSWGVESMDEAG